MSTDTDPARRIPFPGLSDLLRHDLPASIVVFLVALPLSIGLAVATGAPVAAGLLGAVIGGLVAGAFGGSALQVGGPTAGVTVAVAGSVHQFGWAVTCFITAGAGVLLVLFGLGRIGRGALAIAPVVVHAMLAGVGIALAVQQVHVLLGGQAPGSSWESLIRLPQALHAVRGGDLAVGLAMIVVLLGWRFAPAALRRVPAPLAAVVAATLVARLVPAEVTRISLHGMLFEKITLPALPSGGWGSVLLTMLTIAVIAGSETVLSTVAATRLRPGLRCDPDRELIGQGLATVTSGLLGGLPVAAVMVRGSTNVRAGARTRASAMLSGVWVLLFAVAFVDVVQQIPMAALAGLLIVIGLGLVRPAHIRLARRSGDLIVYAVTVLVVVFWNLVPGMLIGLALAFGLLLWRVSRVIVTAEPVAGSARWLVTVDGACTFLALPRLIAALDRVPERAPVTVEMTVDFLDHAAAEALHGWAAEHENSGGTVEFVEVGAARIEDLAAGPPARGQARRMLDEMLGPWRPGAPRDPIAAGITAYHRGHAHVMRPHLGALRDRQNPDALFVTCSDSRLVPNVFTSSGPGDLFTVRNIGNLVPSAGDSSVEAAIVYALDVLGVRSVVVCGHSGCGAMDALYHERTTGSGLDDWLAHGRGTLERFRRGHPVAESAAAAGFGEIDRLGMVNVAVQLETLARHDRVARAVAERGLVLSGLFFDIATARVLEITTDGIAEFADVASGVTAGSRESVVAR
ncbi:SulP family inorganic anion transporter [Nocardia macrotermitis]|uniref:carbonic anhydrase n=1 Tax=Nocardia macrotermitis TaxID=2585198 RepID=A0A7K0D800_9NOCA|nr:SulP family inorganic anion transporter [Nocardia macrotermitis]MQY21847.1 hypothetical protein [Nocardia macrotermitis]